MKRLLPKDRNFAYYWFFDIMIVVMLALAIWNQIQIRDEVRARQQAAYQNCVNSNESRHVLATVLSSAEKLTKANPNLTPKQQQYAVDFYNSQVANIKYSDCSIYKKN
jgi:hypothetical protein